MTELYLTLGFDLSQRIELSWLLKLSIADKLDYNKEDFPLNLKSLLKVCEEKILRKIERKNVESLLDI